MRPKQYKSQDTTKSNRSGGEGLKGKSWWGGGLLPPPQKLHPRCRPSASIFGPHRQCPHSQQSSFPLQCLRVWIKTLTPLSRTRCG